MSRRITRQRGLLARIFIPFGIGFLVLMVLTLRLVGSRQEKSAINAAISSAQSTIRQFKTLRAYYTEHVVKKARETGALKADYEHKGKNGVIPLPATMIQDLSETFEKDGIGTRLALFSRFPFPNRSARKLDAIAEEALAEVEKAPEAVFVRVIRERGRETVRVAIADRMANASCVECHNSHPLSPKKDWKVGEVRGVLEVSVPIGVQLAESQALIREISWISLLLAAAICGLILVAVWRGTIRPFQRIVSDIAGNSNNNSEIASQVSQATLVVASNSSEQAAAVEETTATFNQLQDIAKTNRTLAEKVNFNATGSRDAAARGLGEMDALIDSVRDMSESGKRISEISAVIDDISFQTNLLSLNAAVEAARAGEHGKGFAVVAEAVRSLAQRSAQEAKSINAILSESARKNDHCLSVADRSGATLKELVAKADEVCRHATEILKTSEDQLAAVAHFDKAMSQINETAQTNASSAEEVTALMKGMSQQVNGLRELVVGLEALIDGTDRSRDKAA